MKCDESGATGESDAIKKATFEEVVELYRNAEQQGKDPHTLHVDCFMVSGSKVLEGVGKYVIVAVGTKSFNGRIMMGMCFLPSKFTPDLMTLASSSRRHREHPAAIETERPG